MLILITDVVRWFYMIWYALMTVILEIIVVSFILYIGELCRKRRPVLCHFHCRLLGLTHWYFVMWNNCFSLTQFFLLRTVGVLLRLLLAWCCAVASVSGFLRLAGCPLRFGLSFYCTIVYSFEVICLWYNPRIGRESVAMVRIVRMVVANCHPTSNKRL